MPAQKTMRPPIYQLKVTLKGTRPPIWRRLQVPSDVTLAKLHRVIQVSMGWYNSHLHQFTINGVYYGVPSPDDWQPIKDERRFRTGVDQLPQPLLLGRRQLGLAAPARLAAQAIQPVQDQGLQPFVKAGGAKAQLRTQDRDRHFVLQ